ncbi:peroxisomal biogenesis factor 11 [Mariannaea sp. PMI_226]|nr:peroxisomal biogenesis factor 11 [Mariannaea sp. PMI_226]
MATTYEHFVVFGTDLVGLERIMRLFQAACSLLISYPLLLASVLPNKPEAILAAKTVGFTALRNQINVSRRFVRLFRFLDTLNAGFDAYVAPQKSIEVWLDVISKTSLGLFGMIETMTLIDLLGIENLEIFGPLRSKEIDYQSQYLWFFGLATSVLISLIKLSNINVPPVEEKPTKTISEKEASEKKDTKKKAAADAEEEEKRQKEISAKKKVLLRALVSDVIDILLPGSAIGWVNISGGTVSSAMFFTTLTTGWAAWDRVGARI